MSRAVIGALLVGVLTASCTGEPAAMRSAHRSPLRPSASLLVIDPCPAVGSPGVSGQTTAFGSHTLACLRPGPSIDLRTLGGKRPVLINLWASWCVPCQREMPRLERAYRAHRGELLVLGVDTQDSAGSASSFLRAVGATYPELVDPRGALRVELRAVGLPVTVVIRADGSVAYRRLGEMHPADIAAALAAGLAD